MTSPTGDGFADDRADEYAAYRARVADDHYADQVGERVCHTTLTAMSAGAMLWAITAGQWAYVVVFAVFLAGTRVGVWIAAMTITTDRYGQPLTGADADRLAQLQARTSPSWVDRRPTATSTDHHPHHGQLNCRK